jgi:hypothetical protein
VTIMIDTQRALTGCVDTHADVHVAALIDPQGGSAREFMSCLAGSPSTPNCPLTSMGDSVGDTLSGSEGRAFGGNLRAPAPSSDPSAE